MPKSQGKFTLDELLAAKRQERPGQEFWVEFQRELRIKERRLLQSQQVIENSELDRAIWPRFRKTIAMACAAVSCGAFGFLVLQSTGPALVEETPASGPSLADAKQEVPEAKPSFTVVEAPDIEVAAVSNRVPEAVEVAAAQLAEPEPAAAPVVQVAKATKPAEPNFTLDIKTPFEEMDLEKAVAFNEIEEKPTQFAQGYIDPLSELGYRSKNATVAAYKTGISRVSAMALDSGIIDRDTRWGLRLDQVKLSF